MNKEEKDKELLLKDLSARLSHEVIISVTDIDGFQFDGKLRVIGKNWCRLNIIDPIKKAKVKNQTIPLNYIYIKPYLRPLSSMTEEEKEEWTNLFNKPILELEKYSDEVGEEKAPLNFALSHKVSLDWLYSKHFNVNLPEHLYIKVTEENNPYK